jgi:hypothetical protein
MSQRERPQVRPMTPLEQQISEDGRWARLNRELEERYRCQVIAVQHHQVVAHGATLDELMDRLQEAGLHWQEVAIVEYPDPYMEF